MSDLSNDEVLTNWQECNRGNRQQGADYWYDFMAKRARRGDKDAKNKITLMDRLK